jgi:hypothetical protein
MSIRDRLVNLANDVINEFNNTNATAPQQWRQTYEYPRSPNSQPETHAATRVMPAAPSNPMGAGPWPMNPQSYSVSITLNASGNGTVTLGPQIAKEHWQVASATVSVSTNVKESQCSVFLGTTPVSSTLYGQTETGSTGDTCTIGQDIQSGQLVIAQWTGGDVGSVATMTLTGERTIGTPQQ